MPIVRIRVSGLLWLTSFVAALLYVPRGLSLAIALAAISLLIAMHRLTAGRSSPLAALAFFVVLAVGIAVGIGFLHHAAVVQWLAVDALLAAAVVACWAAWVNRYAWIDRRF